MCMKKIQLLLLGLLMAFTAAARDISVHLMDARGKGLPQFMQGEISRPCFDAYYNGKQLAIADDGGFLMPELTEAGTYTLELRDVFGFLSWEDREQEIQAVFEWDGQKDTTLAGMTSFYYLNFQLAGLTEADKNYLVEKQANIYVNLTGKEYYNSIRITFDTYDGALKETAYCFWNIDRMGDLLKWDFFHHYLGESKGEIANLGQQQGNIEIHATKGKSLLTLGKVTGLDGKPLQQFIMDNNWYENYKEGEWRKYLPVHENAELTFRVKQFFTWTEKIQLTEGEPYCLNIDLRENTAITFQVKKNNGSPLEGAAIYQKYDYERYDTLAVSGVNGTCVAYSKQPGTYDFYVDSDLNFHAPKHYTLPVGESATTFEVGYAGDLLVQLLLKGGNRILQQYGEPRHWGYILDPAKAAEEEPIDAGKAIILKDYIVQDDDILTGCMISPTALGSEQAVAKVDVFTETYAMLPIMGKLHPLTGDIQESFDLTQLQPITFVAPAGFTIDGFGNRIKINEKYAPLNRIYDEEGKTKGFQVHMNPGSYHWTAKLTPEGRNEGFSHPFGKPQSFVVENAPKEVCFIYGENSYYGLNLKVQDEKGIAFSEVPVKLYKYNESRDYQMHKTETDHTGKGLLFSEDKGLYYYEVSPEGYLPQCDTLMIGEERLTYNVSYQNHFVCNVDVNLGRFHTNYLPELLWKAKANLDIEEENDYDGPNSNELNNEWKEDGAYDASTRLVVRPGYIYAGFHVFEEKESTNSIYLPVFLRVGEQNQDFLIDAQSMRIVNFKAEIDPELIGSESHRLYWDVYITNAAGEQVCDIYGDISKILLPPGQYTAHYDFYGEDAAFAGSKIIPVPFEVTDKDITVIGKLTKEGRQKIEINIQNAGAEVTCNSIWFAKVNGSTDFGWDGPVGYTFEQGNFLYCIDELLKDGKVYATEYIQAAILNGKDQVLQADFAGYRFFQLLMHMNGSEQLWIPENGHIDLIGDNLMTEDFVLDFYDEEEQRLALKPGNYTLIYEDHRNSKTYYAELKVTADSPEAIHVNFTEKVPTGIEPILNDGALKAKLVNRQLHIMGEAKAPVQVDIVSVDGRCVQRSKVANGAVLSLNNQLHGVYIVRLKQGTKVVNQKFVF